RGGADHAAGGSARHEVGLPVRLDAGGGRVSALAVGGVGGGGLFAGARHLPPDAGGFGLRTGWDRRASGSLGGDAGGAAGPARGREGRGGVGSSLTGKIASWYGGGGGGGGGVDGSSSVSQLADTVYSMPRRTSTAGDDHTLPHAVWVRSKSQPGRVARNPSGNPSSASLWKPSKRRTLSSGRGRQVDCVTRSNHHTRRPSSARSPNIPPLPGTPSLVSMPAITRQLTTAVVAPISWRSWRTVHVVPPVQASNCQSSSPVTASSEYIVSPPGTKTRGCPLIQAIVGEPA